MNKRWFVLMMLIASFITVSSSDFRAQKGNVLAPVLNDGRNQANVKIEKDYGKMPLTFIPNKGQMNKQVYYYIQGKDKTVYFTSEGVTYSLNAKDSSQPSQPTRGWVVKLDFVGARKNVKPECLEQSGTIVSYFKGKKEEWNAGLQTASKIIYRELWRGIDLVYYGTVNKMKYEFIVHPGADPSQIKLAYRGTESVKENTQGQLEVQTPAGGFFDDTPEAWQEIAGKHESVSLKYAIEKGKSGKKIQNAPVATYGFTVGKYDPNQTLVLDPSIIVYCGYIGGYGADGGKGIVVDSAGCAYVAGSTTSTQASFPETVGPDLTFNGTCDAFVAKVNADGTGLAYCGYIGGNDDDNGNGIALDASGCAYVTGKTKSPQASFPLTIGPDLTQNGFYDVFVAKVNADGTGLAYCGYIGGSEDDVGMGIAVDTSGCAYVTGWTESSETTFPEVVGPDLTYNYHSGYYYKDVFVAKVNTDGTDLDYCGYIGGEFDDYSNGIAVDTSGCAYVIGHTGFQRELSFLSIFPVTVGPDLSFNVNEDWSELSNDAFVAKVKTDGTGLAYCGYIGGSNDDYGNGIAVDALGCAYVTGRTQSTESTFPVGGGPDLFFNGDTDAFVAKVNSEGTGLDFCGYIGGNNEDIGCGIYFDASDCAYVTGYTRSDETTFPVNGGPDLTFNGGTYDAFVAKIDAAGTGLDFCGYIGGSDSDYASGIVLDDSGSIYLTGNTYSSENDFPVKGGPDLTYNTIGDAFVAKISMDCFTVNFIAGVGGTLVGATPQIILNGDSCTEVIAVPNTGYRFVNWTGTGGFITTTDNPLTVNNVTADMTITANFDETNPAGWIPLKGLQYNMIVYGIAYNGNNPAIVGDWIGAFGPGGISDCRCATTVQTGGNYYLTIGSNVASGETITFKLWPISSGASIDSSESVNFIADGDYSGLPLHFGYRLQSFQLVNGWNWISFNVQPDNASLNSIFGSLTGIIEQVKSQTQAAIYTGGTWIGDLTDMSGIANGVMYKVKTNQACALNTGGLTIPFNQSLSLLTGWNWTAYLPTLSQPVEDAVNSIITPVSQVKSQDKSVIKVGSSLYGDLTEMEPNKGYTILMNTTGTLEYPFGVSAPLDRAKGKTTAVTTQAVPWPMIKGNQYNMIAYGKVYLEGKPVNKTGYYLGSYGPKGVSDGRSLNPVKTDGSYFATILGNANGEKIKFKIINSANGRAYDVTGSFNFQADSLKTAFDLNTRSIKLTSPNGGETWNPRRRYDITWRSGGIDNVKIELYKGTVLKTVICASAPAGTGKYTWTIPANIPRGTKYKIKITSVDVGLNLSDAGNDYFTIAGSSGTDGSL